LTKLNGGNLMARYEYTKTFSFYATAEVPYRYT